ncbi:hypothetical protein O3689_10305 [Prevotella nigrescens]|uniref:hypothetical protein n=1 Tax=Prevotella nigrescens TaxID=28133 RepID=UPI00352C7761
MAGKRKPYKGRHTVTGDYPRSQAVSLRSLLWDRTTQKILFFDSKQAIWASRLPSVGGTQRYGRVFVAIL